MGGRTSGGSAGGWSRPTPSEGSAPGTSQTTSIHYLLVQPGLLRRSDFIVDTQKVAHNAYLQAWAETGVIGLALFLGVILGLLACSLKAIRRFERDGNLLMEVLTRAQLIACIGLLTLALLLLRRSSTSSSGCCSRWGRRCLPWRKRAM